MRRLFRVLIISILLSASVIRADANSALYYWEGSSGEGTYASDPECPIIVEHEDLIFDLKNPKEYNGYQSLHKAGWRFSAVYTFKNPTDGHVDAVLSFPFGELAHYADALQDPSEYAVTADQGELNTVRRYTWTGGHYFEAQKDLAKLRDTYIEDAFYRPDLPVTVRTLQFEIDDKDLPDDYLVEIYTEYDASVIQDKTRFCIPGYIGGYSSATDMKVNVRLEADKTTSFAIFGEPMELTWKRSETDEGVTYKTIETETMSYEDYVLSRKPDLEGLTDTDWYNVFTENTQDPSSSPTLISETVNHWEMMEWLQYTLSFEPGQSIVNTVSAPVYPALDEKYEPAEFGVTYLLTPASTWKEFGTLDVIVNTDMVMRSSFPKEMEQTEKGYTVHFDSLPEDELEFRICETANPGVNPASRNYFVLVILAIPLVGAILLMILLIWIIRRIVRRNRLIDRDSL